MALEDGLAADAPDALRAAGFEVLEHLLPPAEFGAGQLVRAHDDGWFEGGADSRRDGVAFGRSSGRSDAATRERIRSAP